MTNVVDLKGRPVAAGDPDYQLPYTLAQLESGLAHLVFIAQSRPDLFTGLRVNVGVAVLDTSELMQVLHQHIRYIESATTCHAAPPPEPPSSPYTRARWVFAALYYIFTGKGTGI